MKEPALVIIKPDGLGRQLVGNILTKFAQTKLRMIGMRLTHATRQLAEEHYQHIKAKPFFDEAVSYVIGTFHREKNILLIIYYGEGAISKCRKIAGATNPEEASPDSIRGSYGRVTTKGVFENVVHVSSSKREAEREIKLWFDPDNIFASLYPTKIITSRSVRKRVWK